MTVMLESVGLGTPGVATFFQGRSVLVTGYSGFMGKVLVEKLLRSCPDLEAIYVIMRGKKGKCPGERLKTLYESKVFDRLKDEQPHAYEKVKAVVGDIGKVGLGLSDEDRHTLEREVSVVFHVAATVKFDDPLNSAVFMNVRGTREVLELCCNMPQLQAMLHVSTAYCNTDQIEIQEQLYPSPGDWRKVIEASETMDPFMLQILSPKILGTRPNTYTYTKALGEHVVYDYRDRVPVVILRPTIVISTWEEPFPGWLDNFNGPVGLMVAGGKGIMKTMWAEPTSRSDYMAVDVAIKSMIVAVWHKANVGLKGDVPIYNCSSSSIEGITIKEVIDSGYKLADSLPLNNALWNPGGDVTRHFAVFYVGAMLMHILPALLVDAVLLLMNKKPMLLRLQRRIYIANTALKYFLHHQWFIPNERFLELERQILPGDRAVWGYDFSRININEYMRDAFIGGRQYLLKEDFSTLPAAKVHFVRMYWLDKFVKATGVLLIAWFVYSSEIIPTALYATWNYLSAF